MCDPRLKMPKYRPSRNYVPATSALNDAYVDEAWSLQRTVGHLNTKVRQKYRCYGNVCG